VTFGINAWLWLMPLQTATSLETIHKVADMGFDQIEVPLEQPHQLDYAQIAEAVKERGLDVSICVAMSPERDLIHPDISIQENTLSYLKHCINTVNLLGGRNVVGPMYASVGRLWQQTQSERAKDVATLVNHLKTLSDYAETKEAVLCIEPLNRFETSFMNLASQAVEVVEQVGHSSCKIQLDSFHMNIEEDSIGDAIRLAGKHLGQLHVCANDRGAPGAGHLNWQDLSQALKDSHFDGPLVIEAFHTDNKVMAAAASIWRSKASSADVLAKEGLEFLQDL